MTWVGFVIAAAIGAPARYLVDLAVADRIETAFPAGTFVVNATGSLVLGFVTGLGLFHGLPAAPRLVLGTGFCGAYTTFSTFTFETVRLLEEKANWLAAVNTLASAATCLTAAAAGLVLASL